MKFLRITVIALVALSACIVTQAQDIANWPQWRGPLANGVAPLGDPPTEWSETKNVKWKIKIPGFGNSTPIIWGDKIFLTTAVSKTGIVSAPARGGPPPTTSYQFTILCLDRNTGKTIWEKVSREETPHETHHAREGSFASTSPVTDGSLLYVPFGSRGFYCYDLDGNLKWERDLGKMRVFLQFGEGSSPVLHDGKLVINWDHDGEDFITALDAKTGNPIWKTPRNEGSTWDTPAIIRNGNQTQVVVAATGKTRSYDLADGKQIWESAGQTRNVIPSPVVGHGLVFLLSGYQGHSLQAIHYDRTGDLTGTDAIAWSLRERTPYTPSALLYDDLIYFLADNSSTLSCYEAKTGKVLIDAQRIDSVREVFTSPVGAAGRVYIMGRDGTAAVLKKGPEFQILATNKLDDTFHASPVIVGKQLFLRGHEYFYCIE